MPDEYIERRIDIYQTYTTESPRHDMRVFEQCQIWKYLDTLPETKFDEKLQPVNKGKCLPHYEGRGKKKMLKHYNFVDIHKLSEHVVHGSFNKIQIKGLPPVTFIDNTDQRRVVAASKKAGLLWSSHFIWWDLTQFPQTKHGELHPEGLLLMEYNRSVGTPKALAKHLNKFTNHYRHHFMPYIDDSLLDDYETPLLEIEFRTPSMPKIDPDDEFADLDGVVQNKGRFYLSVKPERGEKLRLLPQFKAFAMNILGINSEDPEKAMEQRDIRLHFEGKSTGESILERLCKTEREMLILDPDTKSVDPEHAFKMLEDAYDELRDYISEKTARALR